MIKIRKIPLNFRANGYDYQLIKRSERVALYSQENSKGDIKGYEVHKVRFKSYAERKFTRSNGHVDTYSGYNAEVLAKNEDFGTYGWNFDTLENAEKKYKELLNG